MKKHILIFALLALSTSIVHADECTKVAIKAGVAIEKINVGANIGSIPKQNEVEFQSLKNGNKLFDIALENASYEVLTTKDCSVLNVRLSRED